MRVSGGTGGRQLVEVDEDMRKVVFDPSSIRLTAKQASNFSDVLKAMMELPMDGAEALLEEMGVGVKGAPVMNWKEASTLVMMRKAMQGDVGVWKTLVEQAYGKPKDNAPAVIEHKMVLTDDILRGLRKVRDVKFDEVIDGQVEVKGDKPEDVDLVREFEEWKKSKAGVK